MDSDFWHDKWERGQLGFHMDAANPVLVEHGARFLAGGPHRVLVPLCGKSLDLCWLRDQGHSAVGVELVRTAVAAFHAEQGLTPTVAPTEAGHTCFSTPGITVLCGDVLALTAAQLVGVRRVWDRAALVALDPARRAAYVGRLRSLLPVGTRVLLNTFRYDASVSAGPPHSISHAELARLYAGCRRQRWSATDLLRDDSPRSQMLREQGHRHWWSEVWEITL